MLVGRDRQRAAIDQAIAQAAAAGDSAPSRSADHPGSGKTALLAYAAEQADGMTAAARARHRVRGADSVRVAARAAAPGAGDPRASSRPRRPPHWSRRSRCVPGARRIASPLARRRSDCSPPAPSERAAAAAARRHPVVRRPSSEALRFALRRLDADPVATILACATATARCSTAPRSRRSSSTV